MGVRVKQIDCSGVMYLNNKSGCGSLISDSSDTVDSDDAWEVYAWDINEQLVFTNPKDIKTYIDVLEKNIITKQV